MRLAIFSDTYLPQINGVTKTLAKLGRHLQQQGIEFQLCVPDYGSGDGSSESNWLKRFPSYPVPIYPECRLALPKNNQVEHLMDDFKPDLIHLATPFSLGLAGLKSARSRNIPIVASFHTNFDQYLSYYHMNFLKAPVWSFFRWFHNHALLNLCPSHATKVELIRHGINNVGIWGRGVDTEKFSPRYRSEELRRKLGGENKVLLLYVGRLAVEKNLDVLWQALHRVNQGSHPVQLVITGSGPLEKQLRATAPDNVTFTGYLQGEELAAVYASCDIFTFPSTTETLGNVVLEAQASALPVVAPPAGGVKENLNPGNNGLAFAPGNADDLAEKIISLVNNSELRLALAYGGQKHAKTKSWDSIMAGLVEDYRSVLSGQEILAS